MMLMDNYRDIKGDGYRAWLQGVWAWTEVADKYGFSAEDFAVEWSRKSEGFSSENDVLEKIKEYRDKATHNFGMGFVMKVVGSNSDIAREFRR